MSEKLTLPAPSDPDPIFVELESGREVVITDVGSGKHGVLIALQQKVFLEHWVQMAAAQVNLTSASLFAGHGKTALSAMGEVSCAIFLRAGDAIPDPDIASGAKLGDAAAGKPLARL
eukprot:3673703-Rhodomonas_salina.1